ncbi:MAG: hypothetical protein HY692_01870, partial [Cyanobacteria bacterium NC_groundwater_1444_Ag_S-0.65um_54_12]|nr:hypothetical protein [Cyanobacteria bacterium NC_groundwater_1444_Ag_S-0.65um_54_12]
ALLGFILLFLLVACGETNDRISSTSQGNVGRAVTPSHENLPGTIGYTAPNQQMAADSRALGGNLALSSPISSVSVNPTSSVASAVVSPKIGLEAKITDRELAGLLRKKLAAITVLLTNHDDQERSTFLVVAFYAKGSEVELQYRTVHLARKTAASYVFKPQKSVDDAQLELRDSLL